MIKYNYWELVPRELPIYMMNEEALQKLEERCHVVMQPVTIAGRPYRIEMIDEVTLATIALTRIARKAGV
jgi:hypothetical protein